MAVVRWVRGSGGWSGGWSGGGDDDDDGAGRWLLRWITFARSSRMPLSCCTAGRSWA